MFIDIHELELHAVQFAEELQPGAIDFGPEIRQVGALSASGRAELLEEHHGGRGKDIQDIWLVGALAARIEVSCARCLEPVIREVAREFDLLYRPQGTDAGHEELTVTEAEAEIGYYSGEGLQLEEALREQVLLAVPLKTVCREDCKGLCPQCGKNRNVEACSCEPVHDTRWAALKDLSNKLKG